MCPSCERYEIIRALQLSATIKKWFCLFWTMQLAVTCKLCGWIMKARLVIFAKSLWKDEQMQFLPYFFKLVQKQNKIWNFCTYKDSSIDCVAHCYLQKRFLLALNFPQIQYKIRWNNISTRHVLTKGIRQELSVNLWENLLHAAACDTKTLKTRT